VLGDVALGVVPLREHDIAELPDLIRAKKLLGAFRGAPAVDRAQPIRCYPTLAERAVTVNVL
jgi:hypothetical protein